MQLLVITLDESEEFLKILASLKEHGMNGIVMPSNSLKHTLMHGTKDAVPTFGFLSKLYKHDYENSHTVLMLVREEKLDEAREIVLGITKGLGRKGVMFALPVSFWEGIVD